MDPYNEKERGNLFRAVETSYRSLEWARNLNRAMTEMYAGAAYGQGNTPRHDDILPLMNQVVEAYMMSLVANRPRILVGTDDQTLTAFATKYQVSMNNFIEEIRLEEVLRRWVLEAFLGGLGVIKVHLGESGEVVVGGDRRMSPGQPCASNVSLDNFVFDGAQTVYSRVSYAGDMYRLPFEALKSGFYDEEAAQDLTPTTKYYASTDRLESITKGTDVDQDELVPGIDVADIWIPSVEKIYTFAVENREKFTLKGRPLAEMPANFPEPGNYHLLPFETTPENIMCPSQASHLAPMIRLANNLMRKQARRAKNQKITHTYTAAGAEDAKNVQGASDGQWIKVNDAAEIQEHVDGGVDQNTQLFLNETEAKIDRYAGNITALLGLGAQADTVGQEQLIQGSVSKRIASMQYAVVDGSVRLIRNLGFLLWEDKFKVIPGTMPIEGAPGYVADMTWTPGDRQGRFPDYKLNIDLYSMPYQSPGQKVAALNGLIKEIYAPLANMLMQQGGSLNLEKLTEMYADLLPMPQLKQVVQFQSVSPEFGEEGGGLRHDRETPMPVSSSREYIRRSAGGGGQAAQQAAMQQKWQAASRDNQSK